MKQNIISNQVFKELQVPTYDTSTDTGTVVYANRYSGRQSVDMPKVYMDILNSDFGETGNSILVQLEQKIQGFPNGPWYIDSIDDVIYIHNRKFHNGPVHKYTYQGGSGELLDIEFNTQYITKRLDGTMTSGISSDKILNTDVVGNKSFSKFYGDYLVNDTATYEEKMAALEAAYADFHIGKLSYEDLQAVEERYPTQVLLMEDQSNLAWLTYLRNKQASIASDIQLARQTAQESYETFKAEASKTSTDNANRIMHHREVQRILDNQDLSNEVQRIIIEVTKGNEGEERKLLENMQQAAKDGNLEEFMKVKFGASIHVLDEALGNTNPRPYRLLWVDPRDYSDNPKAKRNDFSEFKGAGLVNATTNQTRLAQQGYDNLVNDPSVIVFTDRPDTYNTRVKVYKRMETVGVISQYQVLHAYYTRKYGSGDSGSWKDVERRISEAGNRGKQITERKLICNMTCIGNPKLESSHVLLITNVGKKWSGAWYIKTCTHQFSGGQGYTCRLELVKGDTNIPVQASALGLGTTSSAVANMEANGSDIQSMSASDVRTLFTEDEMLMIYSELERNGRAAANEVTMTILSSKDEAHNGRYTKYGLGSIRQRTITSSTGEGTEHEYYVDPRLKPTTEELKKYAAPASRLVEELENSIKEDKK